jgi:hypothetical protein
MSRRWAARGPPHRCIQAWGPEGGLWASVSAFDGCFLRGSPLARVPLSVTQRNGDNHVFCAD